MSLQVGRKGKLFVKAEATYADPATAIAASNAMRHINVGFATDPFGRVTSPEKKQSPGPVDRFDRRNVSSLSTLEILLRPSGTLNTLPEASDVLEALFGAKTNVTLSTTLTPNGVAVALAGAGAGNVNNGAHQYSVQFFDGTGHSKLSAFASVTVVDLGTNGQVSVTSIPVGPTGTVSRKLYRSEAGLVGAANAKLLTTIADNTTLIFTDNVADAGLGAVATNTNTGVGITASSAYVADAGALAAGDAVVVVVSGVKHVRFLDTVSTTNLAWSPALPSIPADDAVLTGCITFKLTTDLAKSLYAAHYLPSFSRELFGAALDKGTLNFDGTEEARVTVSGPAQQQNADSPQAEPGAFTTVGAQNPPTGMVGNMLIGDTVVLHKNLSVDITNNVKLRNEEAGNDGLATESYRDGRRETSLSLETFAEDQTDLFDIAAAGDETSVFRQNGFTGGNIIAVFMPRVEFKVPETAEGENALNWPFKATVLETADGANDEIRIALA